MISKWFVCAETHRMCVCAGWEYQVLRRNIHNRTSRLQSWNFALYIHFIFFPAAELSPLLCSPVRHADPESVPLGVTDSGHEPSSKYLFVTLTLNLHVSQRSL